MLIALCCVFLPGCDGGGGGGGGAVSGGGNDSAVVFNENELNDFHLTLSPADWESILLDSRGDEWRRATLEWKGERIGDVAVRPGGESSRFPGNPKMSLRLKFDEFVPGREFHGLEALKLEGMWWDPALMRDRLSYWVFRFRMPAPRQAHCRLFVNGELRGLYEVEEVVDDEFVKLHFGGQTGNLYRIRGNGVGPENDPYLYRGPSVAEYMPFLWDPKTHALTGDHTVVPRTCDLLTNNPGSAGGLCDFESLLEYFACEAVTCDIDGFAGDFATDDHFQYYRFETGKFAMIVWDPDNTWGSEDDPPTRSIFRNFEKSKLSQMILNDATLQARYKRKIGEVMDQVPLPAVHARVDFIFDQIRDAAHADTNKQFNNDGFDFSSQYIKDFATQRYQSLREQIAQ